MRSKLILCSIVCAVMVCQIPSRSHAEGTKINPEGMFAGITDLQIDPALEPLVDTYVRTLFDQDFEKHITIWHPQVQACITPETEEYFRKRVSKFSSALEAQGVAKEYRISQFVKLPDDYTDQYTGFFEAQELYMPVEPTHMVVIDAGQEGTYLDESTGNFTGYPGMTLMVSLTRDADGNYTVNNTPCKR